MSLNIDPTSVSSMVVSNFSRGPDGIGYNASFDNFSTIANSTRAGIQNEDQDPAGTGSNGCGPLCYAMISICAVAGIALVVTMSLMVVARKRYKGQIQTKEEALAAQRDERVLQIHALEERLKLVEDRTLKPNASLMKIARGPNALNVVQLKILAANCDSNAGNAKLDKKLAALEERARRMETELTSKNGLDAVIDARYKDIRTRRDTQVVLEKPNWSYRTALNVLHDFYGYRILLGRAPVSNRVGEHWGTMLQENVGVIVWLGPLKDASKKEKIFPYVPVSAGQSTTFQHFNVRTVDTALNEGGCNTFEIELSAPLEGKRRQMTAIHINLWPEYNSSAKPFELAKAVTRVAYWQKKHASYGFPAMAVHCSNGIQESVGFVAVYLGRQMLIHCGTADPMGVLEYVRGRRYLALSTHYLTPQQVNSQLAVISSVLEVIAILLGKEEAGVLVRASSPSHGRATVLRRNGKSVKETVVISPTG